MKYAITLIVGVWIGLAFSRIPHYLDHYATYSLPKPDYQGPKVLGGWSAEDIEMMSRYFNGGKR